jgi:uncharacterized protein YndB with AHSA1/START domain
VDILTTELFRFTTTAAPEAVWRTLTSPAVTPRYFHGLSLRSDWQPGSTVTAQGRDWRLGGEVLAVAEPRRLSFTLAADDDQPETFVTWEVHRDDADSQNPGSIVRLYVDEPDGGADTESAWLPVISALRSVLADAGQTSTTSR